MTTVERGEGTITIGGCWTYEWAQRRRPFIHPLATPSGVVLSRDAPDDHPWHHGLWFTVKFVGDDNFWEEMAPYGVLRHDFPPDVIEDHDGSVVVSGALTWTRPDRTTVALSEHRSFTHVPIDDDAYAIDLDTTLIPHADVRLDRTPFTTWGGYGGLAFRGRADLVDSQILLDDGSGHDRVFGTPSRWSDLAGTVDGAPVGLALLDHPENPRHPTPVYGGAKLDNYGDGWSNLLNAAFLFHDGLDLAAGQHIRLRHRVLVHDGHWDASRLADEWERWAGGR